MTKIWSESRAHGAALLTLLAIGDFADDEGFAYPAIETLARKSRVNRRTVQRTLSYLQKLGELEIEPLAGRHGTHRFRVLTGGGKLSWGGIHDKEGRHSRHEGGASTTKRGGITPPKPSGTVIEPSLEPSGDDAEVLTLAASSSAKPRRKASICPATPAPVTWSPELCGAWTDWQEHMRALRRPLTPPAARALAEQLEFMGNERATAAIRFSIGRGYRAIYEPKNAATQSRGATLDSRFQKAF